MPTENPIIAALANQCGLKWAQCDGESTSGRRCLRHRGHAGKCRCGVWWTASGRENRPTLEAWAAEWAAEHPGEPGPVRAWTSEDGRVRWEVTYVAVAIFVGYASATRYLRATEWTFGSRDTSANVADLAHLMVAADKAGAPW